MTFATPTRDRIKRLSQVDASGCWIWRARLNNCGYGLISMRSDGRTVTQLAHRVSFEAFVGTIPSGLVIDHLCRTRSCVNPAHMEPVTHRENVLRSPITQASINSAKTHCPNGHVYTKANTYLGKHGRQCRTCVLAARAASRQTKVQVIP